MNALADTDGELDDDSNTDTDFCALGDELGVVEEESDGDAL